MAQTATFASRKPLPPSREPAGHAPRHGRLRLGAVLLVVGLAAVVWGGYAQATDPCESGYYLTVDRLDPNESPPLGDERVAFSDLQPEAQHVFREAVDGPGSRSPKYDRASFGDLSHRVVTYRDDDYVTNTMVADCGPQPLELFGPLGGVVSGVGLVVLVGAVAWRRRRPAP